MNFTTLSIETATKAKYSVCKITIIDYENETILSEREWIVEPPNNNYDKENSILGYTTLTPKETKNKPNIFDIWSEIEEILFNKTVISYNANYNFDCLVSSFNYFRAKRLDELKDSTIKSDVPQNNLSCDFLCLSLIFRRLFNNLTSHNLDNICNQFSYDLNSNTAMKTGYLFNTLINNLKINSLIDLKHKCGITIGQVFKYKTFYKTKDKNDSSFVLNEYYPCLPITDKEIFRKYDFNKFIKGDLYD